MIKEQIVYKRPEQPRLTVEDVYIRHGEKAYSPVSAETGLTEGGIIASREVGKSFPNFDMIKNYSSDTARTIDTVELVKEAAKTEKKGTLRLRDELSFHYDHEGQFLHDIMRIKREVFGDAYDSLEKSEQERLTAEATEKQTDYYLSFKDQRPDPQTYSPWETAADIAKLILEHAKLYMPSKKDADHKIQLLNGTHDFNLASFLKEAIGFDSIRDIGGGTKFNEYFTVTTNIDAKGKSISLRFREKEYPLSVDQLREIAARSSS